MRARNPNSKVEKGEILRFAESVRNDYTLAPFVREFAGSLDRYFLTKMDFGMRQWTPLRMSTTWETRQSPTIEVSE
jgi:hypothetical protein